MFAQILQRPALAIVISVIIVFVGALAIKILPISPFPSVAPPSAIVAVSYPGASAEVLVDSVLIIPQYAINGVQDMRYVASAATSAGEGAIQIIFEPGTDPNVAVLNVNNRIQIVKNRLPPIEEREGIIVMQAMTSMLMYVNVYGFDSSRLISPGGCHAAPPTLRARGQWQASSGAQEQPAPRAA
jgi:HAE1 family hydrophobic/amphiphilic exporter-1